MLLFDYYAKRMPSLGMHLKVARIEDTPQSYLRKSTIASLVGALSVALVLLIASLGAGLHWVVAPIAFIALFPFLLYTFINKPHFNTLNARKKVESEIVSCIRFLILELKSERSLYNAIANAADNFPLIGIYLDEIIDKVKMGKTLEQSLQEAVETSPSDNLRNLYWQLLNSLQTGSDITESLKVQLEDVIEAQKIRIEEYGRELNALSLFYMMISIIIPTVGFTIVTAVLTFIGYPIKIGLLIALWLLLSIIQYFFLMMAAHRRPDVEAY